MPLDSLYGSGVGDRVEIAFYRSISAGFNGSPCFVEREMLFLEQTERQDSGTIPGTATRVGEAVPFFRLLAAMLRGALA